MPWSNNQFTGTLVIPTGATTGARIELNGTTGRIEVYDAANALVYVIDGTIPGATAGQSTGPQVEVLTSGSVGLIQFPTNRPLENAIATILAAVLNSGLPNEAATLQLLGPTMSGATDRASILISSQNNDGSSEANIVLRAGSGTITYDETRFAVAGARVLISPDPSANAVLSAAANAAHTGNILQASLGATIYAQLTADGRILLTNTASASSAVFVNTAAGHTGNLLRTQVNGTDKFVVNNDGVLTTYAGNNKTTYSPNVAGGGTATFTTETGWWQRYGEDIFFAAYFVVNAAGSGASNVTIDAPVSIDRTTRQVVMGNAEGLVAGNNGSISAVAFTGSSGASFQRLRNSTGANIIGSDLQAGALVTVEGWVREA